MGTGEARPPVVVVGIGADGWAGLSGEARAELRDAEVVLGSARQLDLLEDVPGERRRWPSPLLPALPGLFDELAGRRVCALASGDPMFYGLGATLAGVLGPGRLRVLPMPSSMSLACARLGWPVQDTAVLSAVGRPLDRLRALLAPGRRLLVLTPGDPGPAAVARMVAGEGYGASELTVLAQLGGPAERVRSGRAGDWREPDGDPLAVVAVRCLADPDLEPLPGTPGLPDDAFEHDGQLTKREVRALTVARLAPLPGQLLWDVGAGAGSVAIEWLRAEPTCRALAVERDGTRADRIRRNAAALGVPGLRVVLGPAPAALDGLEPPDTVFVGGGVGVPGVLETCWSALRPGGRLVANSVTLRAENTLADWYERHGGSLTRVQIQRAAPVGGLTGWRPAMPVTQWVGEKPRPTG
jgi:precorrin-6B C5,15-methyltransferase / cobalt-precorrin-6B C5,C15-methyltransferase